MGAYCPKGKGKSMDNYYTKGQAKSMGNDNPKGQGEIKGLNNLQGTWGGRGVRQSEVAVAARPRRRHVVRGPQPPSHLHGGETKRFWFICFARKVGFDPWLESREH